MDGLGFVALWSAYQVAKQASSPTNPELPLKHQQPNTSLTISWVWSVKQWDCQMAAHPSTEHKRCNQATICPTTTHTAVSVSPPAICNLVCRIKSPFRLRCRLVKLHGQSRLFWLRSRRWLAHLTTLNLYASLCGSAYTKLLHIAGEKSFLPQTLSSAGFLRISKARGLQNVPSVSTHCPRLQTIQVIPQFVGASVTNALGFLWKFVVLSFWHANCLCSRLSMRIAGQWVDSAFDTRQKWHLCPASLKFRSLTGTSAFELP